VLLAAIKARLETAAAAAAAAAAPTKITVDETELLPLSAEMVHTGD
jgi:hypothetical protein